ncbi:hypothetical protein BCF11_3854 [Collimonas sp. PA-H2]|uniref:hypothetical protein n=1 Tax=Collimonas sp. PA-H2 TaxID=1881062 RepID=UPI000BFA0D7D|nr:hypothetical protein [Collimonas sp. PA-H2]PFH11408.1 hypothetical protein BCF11_3854 [Collimonas sp. PA-H2]
MNKTGLLLALCASFTHAADTGKAAEQQRQQGMLLKTITPIYSQLLIVNSPPGFKTAFENTQGPRYIREAVPEKENVDEWTQMVTITGFKDLALNPQVSPQSFAVNMAAGFQHACPTSFSGQEIGIGKISERDAFVLVASCGTSPTTAGKTSEAAVIAVIKGSSDYYTIQWAERGAVSATPLAIDVGKWTEKFRQLNPIKLCPVVAGEAAPYPSCVN